VDDREGSQPPSATSSLRRSGLVMRPLPPTEDTQPKEPMRGSLGANSEEFISGARPGSLRGVAALPTPEWHDASITTMSSMPKERIGSLRGSESFRMKEAKVEQPLEPLSSYFDGTVDAEK